MWEVELSGVGVKRSMISGLDSNSKILVLFSCEGLKTEVNSRREPKKSGSAVEKSELEQLVVSHCREVEVAEFVEN
jgi:hypothetical protein